MSARYDKLPLEKTPPHCGHCGHSGTKIGAGFNVQKREGRPHGNVFECDECFAYLEEQGKTKRTKRP